MGFINIMFIGCLFWAVCWSGPISSREEAIALMDEFQEETIKLMTLEFAAELDNHISSNLGQTFTPESIQPLFDMLDTNEDGYLEAKDITEGTKAFQESNGFELSDELISNNSEAQIYLMDEDQDQKVSLEEYANNYPLLLEIVAPIFSQKYNQKLNEDGL